MRYIAGEVDGVTKWHVVDEAGPDPEALALADVNPLSFHKTACGKHYGNDPVAETTEAFPICDDC